MIGKLLTLDMVLTLAGVDIKVKGTVHVADGVEKAEKAPAEKPTP